MNAPLPPPVRALLHAASPGLSAQALRSREDYARHRHQHLCQSRLRRRLRRVELGEACSLLFENRATVAAHLEEVRFLEGGAWSEERLEREVDAYRVLLPRAQELRATVFLHGGDAALGSALARLLREGRPALALRVAGEEVIAASVDERWDPLCPVLYVAFRLTAAAAGALEGGEAPLELCLRVEGRSLTARLPEHTRFELERDLWESRRAGSTGSSEERLLP